MPYTASTHRQPTPRDELRARIPGWGVDIDPADRPSVPREKHLPTGAHWDFPERQPEHAPRERSLEHQFLTPVFGTTAPLHGASGAIRRLAYRRYSEGQTQHWLLLIAGDRVDAWGSHLRSFATARPDNPVTETGILGERDRHPFASRFGRNRADLKHSWLDPLMVGGPWIAAPVLVWAALNRLRKASRR
jgi:hypothetical protein